MENEAVALGEDLEVQIVEQREAPLSIEQRIAYVEMVMKQHTTSLDSLYQIVKEIRGRDPNQDEIDKKIDDSKDKGKDEIPVGTVLKGMTNGTPYWCVVKTDGNFYVGINQYKSLSAAAEGVSGVRRSGWTFWRFDNGKNEGKTVKEVYRG